MSNPLNASGDLFHVAQSNIQPKKKESYGKNYIERTRSKQADPRNHRGEVQLDMARLFSGMESLRTAQQDQTLPSQPREDRGASSDDRRGSSSIHGEIGTNIHGRPEGLARPDTSDVSTLGGETPVLVNDRRGVEPSGSGIRDQESVVGGNDSRSEISRTGGRDREGGSESSHESGGRPVRPDSSEIRTFRDGRTGESVLETTPGTEPDALFRGKVSHADSGQHASGGAASRDGQQRPLSSGVATRPRSDEPSLETRGNASGGDGGGIETGDSSSASRYSPDPLPELVSRPPADSPERNFVIPSGETLSPHGLMAKLAANIEAIELLKQLETESRQATQKEKATLAKYSGWGALPQVFDDDRALSFQNGTIELIKKDVEFYTNRSLSSYGHLKALFQVCSKKGLRKRV